jgi:hypothetical protein
MGWNGDALTVKFVHSKNKDIESRESGKARHIFANPLIPEICAVLSLGRYFARDVQKAGTGTHNGDFTQQFH